MSINSEVFNTVLKKRQKRSKFDLSHDVKLSLDMGKLVPMYVQECVPGDSIKIQSHSMIRFAPLIAPVMHRIQVKMEYFFVPNRILWKDWETFITGSRNGKSLPAEELPVFPQIGLWGSSISNNYIRSGSLLDYLGLPTIDSFPGGTGFPTAERVSLLPFAAYQRIYDEYYRDENLIDSIYDDSVNLDIFTEYNSLKSEDYTSNAANTGLLFTLRNRSWQHDYFTAALPFAQKGPAVEIPISTDNLRVGGFLSYDETAQTVVGLKDDPDGGDLTGMDDQSMLVDAPGTGFAYLKDPVSGQALNINNAGTMDPSTLNITNVDGGETILTTINDLRTAIKLQEWLETNARGGTRYVESIYAHFGVKSSDKRLQRPEFIGSSRSNVVIGEVMQTSSPQSVGDTPQANMSGTGHQVGSSKNFKYFAEEHGYIIGIMTVIPDTAYFQGIPKHFSKINDRMQYYFPEFAGLGEQEIRNAEISVAHPEPDGTFGYIPRYSEYSYLTSRVAGDFRSTLKYWHLARDFGESTVRLNKDFLDSSQASKRIFAVQSLPDDGNETNDPVRDFHSLYAHVFHSVSASRLMPKYGVPNL